MAELTSNPAAWPCYEYKHGVLLYECRLVIS
ncbi:hypothetical protein A2U01_0068809, partial [Trifolium medium]|nr:hypothetical protein [Trifolium medium]